MSRLLREMYRVVIYEDRTPAVLLEPHVSGWVTPFTPTATPTIVVFTLNASPDACRAQAGKVIWLLQGSGPYRALVQWQRLAYGDVWVDCDDPRDDPPYAHDEW